MLVYHRVLLYTTYVCVFIHTYLDVTYINVWYIVLPLIGQQLLRYTICWAVLKPFQLLLPRLLSINSRAGKTKKPLIQNIGGALRSTDKKRRGKWCSMCVLFQTRYGNLRVPSQCHPPQKIRPYLGMIKGTMMVNNPSIRSSFFGGVALDSHYKTSTSTWFNVTYLYPSWRSRRTFKRVT